MREYFKKLAETETEDANISLHATNNGIDQKMVYLVSEYDYDSGEETYLYDDTNYAEAVAAYDRRVAVA